MAKNKDRDRDSDQDDGRVKRTEPVKRDGAYVMMLFITLVAIATGCVLLYLDNEEYGAKPPQKEVAPTVRKLGEPLAAEPGGAPPAPAPMPPAP